EVVELDRAELPLAPDAVFHVKVELWPVERTVPGVLHPRNAALLDRRAEARFGAIPHLVRSHPLLRAGAEFGAVLEAQCAIDAANQLDEAPDLLRDLRLH